MKNKKALISTIKLLFVLLFCCLMGGVIGYYICKGEIINRAKEVGYPKQYNYTIEDIESIIFNEPQQ